MQDNASQLLSRAKRFDFDALTEIYDLYNPGLYRYSYRLLGDANLAEDCVAETFHRFLLAIKAGGGPVDQLQAYLYRIAHNWITDTYRRKRIEEQELSDDVEDGSAPPVQLSEAKFDSSVIRNALARIAPDQRQVLSYKYLEGFSNEEIAGMMNKTIGAIKALQSRGLESMNRILVSESSLI
jgi:RNA polymerase sigma-70 factor (ECF subfamily)